MKAHDRPPTSLPLDGGSPCRRTPTTFSPPESITRAKAALLEAPAFQHPGNWGNLEQEPGGLPGSLSRRFSRASMARNHPWPYIACSALGSARSQ